MCDSRLEKEAMPDNQPTIWTLSHHTRAKHDLLRRYLGAWFPVLSHHNGRVIFLDAFAGPGVYANDEPGSPTIALNTLLDHQYNLGTQKCEFILLFNEQDRKRFESLESKVNELKKGKWPEHVKVQIHNENFVDIAEDLLSGLEQKQASLAPTFAFLDPFGYKDVPLELISRLLSFDRCELFIYFDYNSVSRFATAGNVDSHFEALFGTDAYRSAPPAGDPNRKTFLHDLYQMQLKEVCGFPYVQSFEMVNSAGKTGNYLFFCTRSIKGLEAMKEAMWKVAPGGDFRYSDLLAGQTILFQDDVDTSALREELLRHFSGSTVEISEIEEFTLVHTPFAKSHVKKRTLAPMQRSGLISSPNQKRKNTFPSGTIVKFPISQ